MDRAAPWRPTRFATLVIVFAATAGTTACGSDPGGELLGPSIPVPSDSVHGGGEPVAARGGLPAAEGEQPRYGEESIGEDSIGEWIQLCEASDLPSGRCTTVRAGDRELALFNVDGEFYALDNACTHEGGPLGEGVLHGHTVSCPWHYAEFDVTTGESLDPIAPHGVESVPVEVRDGVVCARISGQSSG